MSELQGKGRAKRWDEMRGVRAGLRRAERWDEFAEAVRDLKKTPCPLLKGNFGNWSHPTDIYQTPTPAFTIMDRNMSIFQTHVSSQI